jgi:hypothetical protein
MWTTSSSTSRTRSKAHCPSGDARSNIGTGTTTGGGSLVPAQERSRGVFAPNPFCLPAALPSRAADSGRQSCRSPLRLGRKWRESFGRSRFRQRRRRRGAGAEAAASPPEHRARRESLPSSASAPSAGLSERRPAVTGTSRTGCPQGPARRARRSRRRRSRTRDAGGRARSTRLPRATSVRARAAPRTSRTR